MKKKNNLRSKDRFKILKLIKIFGPILAVLISFFTLLHLNKVFKVSNNPLIKFNDNDIYINAQREPFGKGFGYLRTYVYNGEPDPTILLKSQINNKDSLASIWNPDRFNLEIVNIGQGPASNLKFRWSIDTLFWYELFKKYKGTFQFESIKLNGKTLLINESIDTMPYPDTYFTEQIHYLLPISTNPQEVLVKIPMNYIRLICFLMYYSSYKHEFIFDFPSLFLEIEYLDSRNKLQKTKFEFLINGSKDLLGELANGCFLYYPGILHVKQIK